MQNTERLFSQVKHSMRAINRKSGNVLTTVLVSMQAKEIVKTGPDATSNSIVSRVSKQVPPYKGTCVSKSFVNTRIQSWQAHLERISPYLEHEYGGRQQKVGTHPLIWTVILNITPTDQT